MGLFSRNKPKQEETVEKREEPQVEVSTVPVGLSFLLRRGQFNEDAVAAFWGGLELISNSVAGVPVVVRSKTTNEVIEQHPLSIVLENGLMTKFMLIKSLIQDTYKYGNGFAWIKRASDGTPIEIVYRPHGTMSIVYNSQNRQLYYIDPAIKKGKIEPINVIHIYKNTKDGINGIGLPFYAQKILGLANATDNAAKDFFDSGCNLSGVLKSNRPLTSAQKIDVLNSWRAAFNGSQGANVGILGNDMDFQSVGVNSSDSQLLESREFNVQEIARYLNISPILLGVQSGATYNSIEQANLDLIVHTLLPLINILQEEFNRKLLKPSERDLFIDFDEDKIAFASKNDTANYLANLTKNGIISINEARAKLGLTPRDGADRLIIPFTDINANTVDGNKNNEEEDNGNN